MDSFISGALLVLIVLLVLVCMVGCAPAGTCPEGMDCFQVSIKF